jgi:hypothetical protein
VAVNPETSEALRGLAARYARATDTFDGGLLADCFLPDGVLRTYRADRSDPILRRGAVQLATAAAGPPGRVAAFHHLGQTTFRYADAAGNDDVLGEIYCVAHQLSDDGTGEILDSVYYIRYEDRYTCTDQTWKIAERDIRIDFQSRDRAHSVAPRWARSADPMSGETP